MIDIEKEAQNYLTICSDSKGLSALSIKAYKIDLKQFCRYMKRRDCLTKRAEYIYKFTSSTLQTENRKAQNCLLKGVLSIYGN